MDEIRRQFERWLASNKRGHAAFDVWLAGYKMADRKARLECAEICSELRRDNYAGENEDWIAGADDCAKAIRATIKEE